MVESLLKEAFPKAISAAFTSALVAFLLLLGLNRYKQAHLRNIPGPPMQSFAFGD